jgi:hypothetical protein
VIPAAERTIVVALFRHGRALATFADVRLRDGARVVQTL